MTESKTTKRPANQDMIDGYMDGRDLSSPEPSGNRSRSYKHGFANGRDDHKMKARASYEQLVKMADEAMDLDENDYGHVRI